jgi:HEAT repeat protein
MDIGHEEAQNALISVIESKATDWDYLFILIPTLSLVEKPSERTIACLRNLSRAASDHRIKSTATLGIGSVARSLSFVAPEKAARIIAELGQELSGCNNDEDRVLMIQALGNAGTSQIEPFLTPYLDHSNPTIRAKTSYSLRWIEGERADQHLIKYLGDTEEAVRLEALSGLSLRPMSTAIYEAEKQCFLSDSSTHVRLIALRNMVKEKISDPATKIWFKEVLKREANPEVKKALKQLLNSKTLAPQAPRG